MFALITRKEVDVLIAHYQCDAARWSYDDGDKDAAEFAAHQANYWHRRRESEDTLEEAVLVKNHAGEMD